MCTLWAMNASRITLKPGQSVDVPDGYIARSYSGSMSYYAERLNEYGESVALSENFPTYEAAARWLAARS